MGHAKKGHAKEPNPPRVSIVYSSLLAAAGLAFFAGFVLAALGFGRDSPLHVIGLGGAEIQSQSLGFGLMILSILLIVALLRYKPPDVGVFAVETSLPQLLPAPERRVARWMLVVSIALFLVMVVLSVR